MTKYQVPFTLNTLEDAMPLFKDLYLTNSVGREFIANTSWWRSHGSMLTKSHMPTIFDFPVIIENLPEKLLKAPVNRLEKEKIRFLRSGRVWYWLPASGCCGWLRLSETDFLVQVHLSWIMDFGGYLYPTEEDMRRDREERNGNLS